MDFNGSDGSILITQIVMSELRLVSVPGDVCRVVSRESKISRKNTLHLEIRKQSSPGGYQSPSVCGDRRSWR